MIGGLGAIDFTRLGKAAEVTQGATAAAATAGASFASMLGDVANNAVATLGQAEQLSAQGLKGNADARGVADAVMSAERTLQAAVAIRDKIVSAYLEISRMSI